MARVGTVLVAAGASERIGGETPKQFALIGREPMFVAALSCVLGVSDEVVVVAPSDRVDEARELIDRHGASSDERFRDVPVVVVAGGSRRQDSVLRGLDALSDGVDVVLVHDAARPFATPDLAARVAEAAERNGAAVPAVTPPDTVKQVDGERVEATLDRRETALAQTPQGFRLDVLRGAYDALGGRDVTDDAQAVELSGVAVTAVPGEPGNFKVTTALDLDVAAARAGAGIGLAPDCRVGTGNDAHRLVAGRRLVLCGVEVPHEKGLDGHSDADVATHAVCDALLGAVAAGDIGVHFPPGDPEFKDISSLVLLERVASIVRGRGFEIGSIDVTIVAEEPRLGPYIERMRAKLAQAAGVEAGRVSVKATTTEGTGPEGEGLAMSSSAAAVVRKSRP